MLAKKSPWKSLWGRPLQSRVGTLTSHRLPGSASLHGGGNRGTVMEGLGKGLVKYTDTGLPRHEGELRAEGRRNDFSNRKTKELTITGILFAAEAAMFRRERRSLDWKMHSTAEGYADLVKPRRGSPASSLASSQHATRFQSQPASHCKPTVTLLFNQLTDLLKK